MARMKPSKLEAVVGRFYEAAAQPELWPSVLADYADAAGAMGTILLPGPALPLPPTNTESLGETTLVGVRDGWYANNPRVERGMKAVRSSEDIITEQRIFQPDELAREPFYADFLYQQGGGWFAGMIMADAGPASLFLSLERSRQQGPFEQHEVDEIAKFARHFRQAGRLAIQIAGAHARGILSGLEMLACGGVLIDASGAAVDTNAKADRLLGDGLVLTARRLVSKDPAANAMLQRLIGSLVRPSRLSEVPEKAPIAIPRAERRPLIVHGTPVTGSLADLFRKGCAILMIVDPEEHRDPAEPILRQAFGLTQAECRIAIAIGRGRSPEHIARGSGVSEATVRTQIKSILAKTDTHRQAELVSLMSRMAVGIR